MFLQEFRKNKANAGTIRQALAILNDCNFFTAWMDLADQQYNTDLHRVSQETAALLHAGRSGYTQAIQDLLSFPDYVLTDTAVTETALPDFGALDVLVKSGEITEDERNKLKERRKRELAI